MSAQLCTLGSWSLPITIVCIVGVMNAINMSDGLDGLAGSLVLAACLGFGYVAGALGKRRIAFICGRESLELPRLAPLVKQAFGGVFIANDGPHVYNAWVTAHGDLFAPQRFADYRVAAAAEAVARAKADLATRGLTSAPTSRARR